MKKALSICLTIVMLISLAACSAPAIEEMPEPTPEATPEPIPQPTPEPTPEPDTVPESVQAFFADAQQYIISVLSDGEMELGMMLSPLNTQGVLDTSSTDLLQRFRYESFTDEYDAESGQFVNTNKASSYDLSLKLTDPSVDWSNSFNYNTIAMDIGSWLDLEYKDETITIYSDGKTEKLKQKWALGRDDGFATSWIYIDESYTDKGTVRLTYVYPGQKRAFNQLVSDSFIIAQAPFISILDAYDQTYSVGYSPNYNLEDDQALPNVATSYWRVTADDIQMLIDAFSADASTVVIMENDFYHAYKTSLENEYLSYMYTEFYPYYDESDDSEPGYLVNCYIYYK